VNSQKRKKRGPPILPFAKFDISSVIRTTYPTSTTRWTAYMLHGLFDTVHLRDPWGNISRCQITANREKSSQVRPFEAEMISSTRFWLNKPKSLNHQRTKSILSVHYNNLRDRAYNFRLTAIKRYVEKNCAIFKRKDFLTLRSLIKSP